ncbi:MAG: CARDB domain-containing protein [Bacteroidota bacterium]
MKNLILLFVFCFVAQLGYGQRIQQLKYPVKVQKNIPNKFANVKLTRPDLVVLNNFQMVMVNGRRCLVGYVKNIGNASSIANNTEIRISWRVDYEHWTTQERFVNKYVPPLAPGKVHKIQFFVPDHAISSNQPYGSKHVSFRYFVDNQKKVFESLENNNIRSHYLPILDD